MARRVALGALPGGGRGLRVSRPGFDVLDPALTGQQLAFDSRWPTAARLHMEGSVVCGPAGNITTYTTIGFGIDFGVLPPVLVQMNNGNGWQSTDWNYNGGSWQAAGGAIEACRIFTSYMQFWHPVVAPTRTYRYLVMRPW